MLLELARKLQVFSPLRFLSSKAGGCHTSERAHRLVVRYLRFHEECTNKLTMTREAQVEMERA